jgi:hypothetical protein
MYTDSESKSMRAHKAKQLSFSATRPRNYTYLSHDEYELQEEPVLKQSNGRFTSGMAPITVLQPFRVIVGQPEVKSGAILSVLTPYRHAWTSKPMQELPCGALNHLDKKKLYVVRGVGS